MNNWLKWKLVWCIIYVAITYTTIKNWVKTKGFYTLVYICRLYVIVDFTLACLLLPAKFKPDTMYKFGFLCTYLVLMVIVYIMLGKLMKYIKEDKKW